MLSSRYFSSFALGVTLITLLYIILNDSRLFRQAGSTPNLSNLTERLHKTETDIAELKNTIKLFKQKGISDTKGHILGSSSSGSVATKENTEFSESDTQERSAHALPNFLSSSDAVAWGQENILHAEKPPRRMQALQLLIKYEPAAAVDAVHALIAQNDSNISDVIAGFGIIEMAESPDAMLDRDIRQFYQSTNPQLRRISAKVLLDRGDPSLAKDYIKNRASMLKDSSIQEKSMALDEIGSMGNKIAVPYIVPMLDDSDAYIKIRALNALTHTGSEDNIADISHLLDDEIASVREKTVAAIDILRHGGISPITHPQGAEIRAGMMANRVPME